MALFLLLGIPYTRKYTPRDGFLGHKMRYGASPDRATENLVPTWKAPMTVKNKESMGVGVGMQRHAGMLNTVVCRHTGMFLYAPFGRRAM